MYSQNLEEKHILEYFKGFKGCLLDIGANDGKTFSNSLALIEIGWEADLVEPSPRAFKRLEELHGDNMNIHLWNVAIANFEGVTTLHESGAILEGDVALVSSIEKKELKRWPKTSFKKVTVPTTTFSELYKLCDEQVWDFITIDSEGWDYQILTQIDLSNTKMVCVEHNGIEIEKYKTYCEGFGMKEIYRSGENIIMAK